MFRGISQDINPLAGVFSDRFVDSLNTISRKNLVVDCLLCPAVCNAATVKRKDITSVIFQMKLFGQRHNALCRAAAGEYNFFSGLLDLDQSFQGRLCNFFFGVGKSSVQIKDENLIIHKYVLLKSIILPEREQSVGNSFRGKLLPEHCLHL